MGRCSTPYIPVFTHVCSVVALRQPHPVTEETYSEKTSWTERYGGSGEPPTVRTNSPPGHSRWVSRQRRQAQLASGACGPGPSDTAEWRDAGSVRPTRLGRPDHRLRRTPSGGHRPALPHSLLTACTTNNTFDALASTVTRANEVFLWSLNVRPPLRRTSAALINIFGGGSRLRPHLKERRSVRSSMRFSPATSASQRHLERYGYSSEEDHMKGLHSDVYPPLGCWQ